jgi:hypothetical protein
VHLFFGDEPGELFGQLRVAREDGDAREEVEAVEVAGLRGHIKEAAPAAPAFPRRTEFILNYFILFELNKRQDNHIPSVPENGS